MEAIPVIERQDLGTCCSAAAHMAALAGTAVVPPRRRTPCDTRRTSRPSKSEFMGWAKLQKEGGTNLLRKSFIGVIMSAWLALGAHSAIAASAAQISKDRCLTRVGSLSNGATDHRY